MGGRWDPQSGCQIKGVVGNKKIPLLVIISDIGGSLRETPSPLLKRHSTENQEDTPSSSAVGMFGRCSLPVLRESEIGLFLAGLFNSVLLVVL